MIKLIIGGLVIAGMLEFTLSGFPSANLTQSPSRISGGETTVSFDDDEQSRPVEQGKVSWLRDYDQAIGKSKESGKPLFVLFQEIPG
jgi:hypothetical protein